MENGKIVRLFSVSASYSNASRKIEVLPAFEWVNKNHKTTLKRRLLGSLAELWGFSSSGGPALGPAGRRDPR
jgi:hypothetical protein